MIISILWGIYSRQINDNCFIRDKISHSTYDKTFILDENSKTKIVCDIVFYPSSVTSKYLPRLTFKKIDNQGQQKDIDSNRGVIIAFQKSEQALVFWKLIGFLNSFKDIVDTGEFGTSFGVYSKNKFIAEFETQTEMQKVEDIKTLINKSEIKENDIRSILFEKRKYNLNAFLFLLKNIELQGRPSIELYTRCSSFFYLKGVEKQLTLRRKTAWSSEISATS